MWFVLVVSLAVGSEDGVTRYEDVEVRFKSLSSCRYVTDRIAGVVRIKKPCTQVADL